MKRYDFKYRPRKCQRKYMQRLTRTGVVEGLTLESATVCALEMVAAFSKKTGVEHMLVRIWESNR